VSAPSFRLHISDEAAVLLGDLAKPKYREKRQKVLKTLRLLRDVGPTHPRLQSHKYHSLTGPNGEDVWESYIENRTPGAWRLFWTYGPDPGSLTIVTFGPHP
jgi:hypothetical protein